MNKRPLYHITPPCGWINDPNGVIKFKNQYHVFYQYHPFGLIWGPMHWGHVVSDDLLHWKELPIALTPGDEFDKDGCFSGSSIIYNDRLYIIYTGFIFNEDNEKIIQQQCLAYSEDGVNFTKVGLIIGKDNLSETEKKLDTIITFLGKYQQDINLMRKFKRKGKEYLSTTNSYFYAFSLIETIILIIVSLWQYYYLKHLFEIKGSL